ncbi:MAG TPA: cohesin domain-containing protein [Steroidobacteraceae bacterium]|nr:cohesin domain-containing protein [Steroidobacteraceae bacterium]
MLARLPVAIAAVCALLLVRTPSVQANPSATLSMSPSSQSLNVGQSVLVVVSASNATSVNDVAFRITYDPSIVAVTDSDNATPGTQILPGWFPGTDLNYQTEGAVLTNSVNPAGQINYEYQLNSGLEVSGGGTVATIQFIALANGNANIQWSWVQVKDGTATPSTPALGNPTIVVVGGAVPTATPTLSPTVTATPTSTPVAPSTATPQATATSTNTPVTTATGTPAATTTGTPAATTTAAPTATPRITVISNANQPTPALAAPPAGGVEPTASGKAGGLPSAGNDGATTQWWKWSFFGGALMLALAGWFFTFALHAGDREVVLTDRFDRRRRLRRR